VSDYYLVCLVFSADVVDVLVRMVSMFGAQKDATKLPDCVLNALSTRTHDLFFSIEQLDLESKNIR
jgi:hypothetical protein